MSDTEQLFLVAAVWALIAAAIARFIPNWPGRIAFFVLAVGIPFWELPYGYYNLQMLCREQGGLEVFEPILPQKIVCVAHPYESGAPGMIKAGFETVEAKAKSGSVNRISIAPSGQLESTKQEQVTSDYCVTFANNNHLPWRIIRHDFLVIRVKDGVVVARHSVFDWFGMGWQQSASPVLGRGGECREDPIKPVVAVLLNGSQKFPKGQQ
jgi:hypothetical protein